MSNSKNLYINSAPGFRDIGGTDEDFTITKTTSTFNLIPKKVKLLSARIPFVWDNVTTSNNAFTLIELPGPIVYPNLTVPATRYTPSTLEAALKTALDTAGAHTYTVAYNSTTLKYTISATGDFQINFAVSNSIAPILGFDEITTASATSITSTNATLLETDTEIFIGSSLVGGIDNGIVPYFTGATNNLQILASIPIGSTTYGNIIDYTSPNDEPYKNTIQSGFAMVPNTVPSFEMSFNLFFISGIPVSLKGVHWSANILLEF